jgi:hypothetical protein
LDDPLSDYLSILEVEGNCGVCDDNGNAEDQDIKQ